MEDQLQEGARVAGRYTLLRRLGAGGMGEVWLALSEGAGSFRRQVVLKTVAPDHRGDERLEEMLGDEARVLGFLHHPGIVTALDFVETESGPLLVLDYVDGPSLRSAMKLAHQRRLALPEALAAYVGAEVARALDAAHRATDRQGRALGIVHRDVSPDNVLLARDGHVLLADFGVARAATNSDVTMPGAAPKGKRGYMAPEQMMGQPVGPTADVFALGRVIAEAVGEGMSKPLWRIVEKATARSAADRYQSGAELAQALVAAVPPPVEPERALAAWLAQAAPEALGVRQTSPGERTPVNAHTAPLNIAVLNGAPSATPSPPLFEGVARRRPARLRLIAAAGALLALGLPVALIASQHGRGLFRLPLQSGLRAAGGELRVRSQPAGAEIYVDGQLKGLSPLELQLPAGKHQLRVGAPKLEKWRALEVQIAAGRTEERYVDLTE